MRTRVGVLALMALLSVSCGKIKGRHSDGGPEPDANQVDAAPPGPCDPGAEPTAEEGYACLLQAACTLVTRCFVPLTVEQCMRSDFELFEPGVGAFHHRPRILEEIEAGRIDYHPEAVADCFAQVTALECPFLFEHMIADFSVAHVCPGVFVGTVAATEPCFTDLECEGEGAVCQYGKCTEDSFCCAGTCVLPAGTSSACSTAQPCVLGSYCVDGICRAGDATSSCNSTADCDDGFWCSGGTCTAEVDSGADCTNFEECSGPEVCVQVDANPGTCGRVDQADAMCGSRCFGFECIQPDPSQLGTCQPFLEEGDDCSGDRICPASYECPPATYQCDPRGSIGDPCSEDEGNGCMPGLFCTAEITGEGTGICSERLADGEHCADESDNYINDDECQSDVCAGDPGTKTCQPFPGCL